MNAYLRAAAKHAKIKRQAEERLERRKDKPQPEPNNGRRNRRPTN